MKRSIVEIRQTKKECDWGKWKKPYDIRACLDYDDCQDCGAFEELKCSMCARQIKSSFLTVEEHTGKLTVRFLCNYKCLDKFLHEKLHVTSEIIRLKSIEEAKPSP